MSLRVDKFLENVETDIARVILEHSKPSDTFKGIHIPDITRWRFCDVMDMSGKDVITGTIDLLKFYGNIGDNDIFKGSAAEFASLVRFVKTEVEKAGKLMEQLQSEPDPDMVAAGINKLDRFGAISIYYGISRDPRDWDAISEVPFGKMYTKLMMDKISGDIQGNYTKIMNDRQKNKR